MQAEYEVIKQDNVEIIKEEERIARANAMVPLEKNYLTDYQKYTEDNMFNEEMKEKEDEFEDDYNEYDLEDTKEDLNDDSFYDFDSVSGFDNPISKIKGKFNHKDLSYTKSFKDKIKDGADVMSNALDGLKSGLSTAKDSMANSIDKIKTKISNKDTGFMKGLKDKTVEGANTLTDAMKGVKNKVAQAKDYVEDSLGLGV